MSVPPPAGAGPPSGPPGQPADRRREIVLQLHQPRGWRRRAGLIRLLGPEITIVQPGVLREPLTLPGGMIEVASVDRRTAAREGDHGRFPILHRAGSSAVVPFAQGIEGWVWTAGSGSALPTLGEHADAGPNLVLLFAKPLGPEEVARSFEPEWVKALADRSPLGTPSVPGLLAVVENPSSAEDAFRQFGVLGPLTDREIPPTMRRHLPGDRPANPQIAASEQARAHTSVAPPGMG